MGEINLDQTQALALVEVLKRYNLELTKEMDELQKKYSKNIDLINNLKPLTKPEDQVTLEIFDMISDYEKSWSWREKILHILQIKHGYLSARGILSIICNHEPKLKGEDRKSFTSMSSVLTSLAKEGIVKRKKHDDSKEFSYIIK